MDALPADFFRDMKTQDTTGQKALRWTGLIIWALFAGLVTVGAPPVGVVLLILTIIIRTWMANRRDRRYSRNAAKLALLHDREMNR